eukprot:gene7973-9479_t
MDAYLRSPVEFTTQFSSALAAWIDDEFAVIDRANAYGPGYTNEVLGRHEGLDVAVRVVYPPEVATSAGFDCQQGAASTCGRLLATVLEDPALLVAASEYLTSAGFVVVMATGVSTIEAGVRVETATFAPPPPAPPAAASNQLSVTAICLLVAGLAGMTLAVGLDVAEASWGFQVEFVAQMAAAADVLTSDVEVTGITSGSVVVTSSTYLVTEAAAIDFSSLLQSNPASIFDRFSEDSYGAVSTKRRSGRCNAGSHATAGDKDERRSGRCNAGSHATAGDKDAKDEKIHVSPEGEEPQERAITVHDKAKMKDASQAAISSLPPSSIFATAASKSLVLHDERSPRSPTSLLPDDSVPPQAQLQNFLGDELCDSLKLSSP